MAGPSSRVAAQRLYQGGGGRGPSTPRRGSVCVSKGGEKVVPSEVERVTRGRAAARLASGPHEAAARELHGATSSRGRPKDWARTERQGRLRSAQRGGRPTGWRCRADRGRNAVTCSLALRLALEYSSERRAFGADDRILPSVAVRAGADGDRAGLGAHFVDEAVRASNAGTLGPEEAGMAKWWCTEVQNRVRRPRGSSRRVWLRVGVPIAPALVDGPDLLRLRRNYRDWEGHHRAMNTGGARRR